MLLLDSTLNANQSFTDARTISGYISFCRSRPSNLPNEAIDSKSSFALHNIIRIISHCCLVTHVHNRKSINYSINYYTLIITPSLHRFHTLRMHYSPHLFFRLCSAQCVDCSSVRVRRSVSLNLNYSTRNFSVRQSASSSLI
jgi:hypothetical protein